MNCSNSKTGFRNLTWFPSSAALTVSCSRGCEQKKVTLWLEKVPFYRQRRDALLEKVTY